MKEIDGASQLVAACTRNPIVRVSLEDIQDAGQNLGHNNH